MRVCKKERQNLTTIAYETIRNAICGGELKAGDIISENLLAQDLGMSRTPVREALRILETQDMVEIRDGIGTYVKMMTYQDMRDIFEVRRVLEIMAAGTAINFITESEIDNLRAKFLSLLARSEKGDVIDFVEFTNIDWELHELIVEKCHNRYVKKFMLAINDNIKRCQFMSAQSLGNLLESTEQHLKILKLIHEKDEPGLEAMLNNHIDWSLKYLVDRL